MRTPLVGYLLPSISDGITYRWNGTAWRPWNSDWVAYQVTTYGFTVSNFTTGFLWRYIAGEVEVRFRGAINAIADGYWSFTLPVPAEASPTAASSDLIGNIRYYVPSLSPNLWQGGVDIKDNGSVWLHNLASSSQPTGQSVLARIPTDANHPVAFTTSSAIEGRFRYTPA